jgi:hypothetical protein
METKTSYLKSEVEEDE